MEVSPSGELRGKGARESRRRIGVYGSASGDAAVLARDQPGAAQLRRRPPAVVRPCRSESVGGRAEGTVGAQVRCIVRYTSPKGQNSYSKGLEWNFDGLRSGLTEMKQIQEAQSTATFLRQQERNRMSASLRYRVLSRDDSRCTRCGATPQTHGISLHVDHIVPVSMGGTSEMDNLQTLCAPCNLGKSNRH
jgi:5-methylcytosine-specific restriction endonuclease McrA